MLHQEKIYNECVIKAVKSSGAGGQHVNKVSTKIEVYFNIETSNILTETQKELLFYKLGTKLTKQNELIVTCQDTRSQLKNKNIALKKLVDILTLALLKQKKRQTTRVPKSVKLKRLKLKRTKSEVKQNRRKPRLDS